MVFIVIRLLVIHSFPGCLESFPGYTEITVEDNRHCVSLADDGSRLAGSTIFLFAKPERNRDPVPSTGGVGLNIKTIEGELDLFS